MVRKQISTLLELQEICFSVTEITAIIRLNHQALDACLSQLITWTIGAPLTFAWNHVASQNAWSNVNRIN